LILLRAGPLAEEEDISVRGPSPGYCPQTLSVQLAASASLDLDSYGLQIR